VAGFFEADQPVAGEDAGGGDAAEGVEAGADGPDADGPQESFLVSIQSTKRPAQSMLIA
jgi:hypothetical protein